MNQLEQLAWPAGLHATGLLGVQGETRVDVAAQRLEGPRERCAAR